MTYFSLPLPRCSMATKQKAVLIKRTSAFSYLAEIIPIKNKGKISHFFVVGQEQQMTIF